MQVLLSSVITLSQHTSEHRTIHQVSKVQIVDKFYLTDNLVEMLIYLGENVLKFLYSNIAVENTTKRALVVKNVVIQWTPSES